MRTILLSFLLLFIFLSAPAQHQEYKITQTIGQTLSNPYDLAIAPDGNIYVVDHFNVKVFNTAGVLLKEHFLDGKLAGFGITVDSHGNFYVTRGDHTFCKYSQDGELLMRIGGLGSGPAEFNFPNGIELDAAGNIYVADTRNHRIQKFSPQGKFMKIIGSFGYESGTFDEPTQVKIDAQGKINVADTHRFQRFDAEGNFEMSIEGEAFIGGLGFDKVGNIYIVNGVFRTMNRYSPSGKYIDSFFQEGPEEGSIYATETKLRFDREGYLYILERDMTSHGNRIQKFSPSFEFLHSFGNVGRHSHNGLELWWLATFDKAGNFYTFTSEEIKLYRKDGTFVRHIAVNLQSAQIRDAVVNSKGELLILSTSETRKLSRFSSTGEYKGSLMKVPYPDQDIFAPDFMKLDAADNIYLFGKKTNGNRMCYKFSPEGNFIKQINFKLEYTKYESLIPTASITIDPLGNFYAIYDKEILKFDPSGNMLFALVVLDSKSYYGNTISSDNKGYLYVTDRLGIKIFDPSGKLVNKIEDRYTIASNPQNAGLYVSYDGTTITHIYRDGMYFNTIRTYSTQEQAPIVGYITGNVFLDANSNCIQDNYESSIQNIIVEALPGPYYAKSDKDGFYQLEVPTGSYTIKQVLPQIAGKQFEQLCPTNIDSLAIDASDLQKINYTINFANRVSLSPHLSVSVSSTRRRRCFESTTTVRYSNSGFATAPDAKVYLQLPKEMGLLSADKSYTRLADGTYEFKVGDLAGGQSGTITIQDIVTCGDESVRGLTVCTRVWITPSNNKTAEPTPTVSITGRCHAETGMIRFVVRNTGTADMDQYELFRKFANGELASQEQFRLAAGDSLVLWVPSMGYTWRLEADQPDGNGDNTAVSVTIEGCPGEASSSVSTGMVNLLPSDDEEAERSEECMPITDSYDPNDKLVTPMGRTEEFYTPTNTALKYKIRFQNTGTDVAYRIVVVDTLSEHLDLSTLQLGATSHPSRVEVSGKGRPVLTWTFDNIMLPDSTADEPGSHGYIQFSIKPKADLPEKTLVENFADIFFDFNSPIRTNVTQNRIYDMPPVINESVRVHLEDVLATPGIAGFSPSAGRFGTEVTITGQRFAMKPGESKVYLNGRAATVVSATATELKVLVPTGTATGNLKVITPDGGVTSADKFEVYQPPVLSSFSPAEGMVGETVTLSGEHLQAELIEEIRLGDLTCEILSSQGNTLTLRVPAAAATGKFQISTKGGQALSSAAYTVWYAPAITALSQQTDIVGASVTIMGEHFATDKARNQVRFGQARAEVLEASPQQLIVRVPEGAESGFISIETPGGKATATTTFEVIPGPKFTAMQPTKGTVGTVVEITGEHFGIMGQQDKIVFNGQEALVLESAGDRYKVRVPRGASTGKVTVTGFGGKAHSSSDFVVEELAPAEAVTVYPNPNNGQFTLSLRHADFDVQLIEVHDALGKRLHQTHIPVPRPEAVEINLPAAKAGLYFLQIQTERGMITKKLTVL